MAAGLLNADDTVSLSQALRALYGGRWRIAACTAITLVLGVCVALLLPKAYMATGTLLPPSESGAGSFAAGGGTVISLGGHTTGDLYVALLKSRSVADDVIAAAHLEKVYGGKPSQMRGALAAHTKIELDSKSSLITLSIIDSTPERAASIFAAYVDAYRKLSAHLAVSEAARRRAFFDQRLLEAKDNLATAEEQLALTEQHTGLMQPDSQVQALIGTAATLRGQVAAKQVQVEAMQEFATAENPQMKQARTELASLEGQLSALERSGGDDPEALIVNKTTMQHGGLQYVRRLREVRYYEAIYDTLARQLETARLDEAREGSGIQVVDTAIPPDGNYRPRRKLIIAASLVLGLFAGVVWVLAGVGFADYRARRLLPDAVPVPGD